MSAAIKQNGSTRFAITGLRSLDARAMQAAGSGLAAGLQHAAGVAQQKYLSGPRPVVLDAVTGRLRGSIATEVRTEGDRIVGQIGTTVPYAMTHEFGLVGHAPIHVKAHERGVNTLGLLQTERLIAKGKRQGKKASDLYRYDARGNRIGYKTTVLELAKRRGQENEIEIQRVGGEDGFYRKNFTYTGRPFLRPALQESGPVILAEIQRALAALSPS